MLTNKKTGYSDDWVPRIFFAYFDVGNRLNFVCAIEWVTQRDSA